MLRSRALRPSRPPNLSACRSKVLTTLKRTSILPAATSNNLPPSKVTLRAIESLRTFTTSSAWQKKGGKAARDAASSSTSKPSADDPTDFSSLEAAIAKVIEKLKDDLVKLRPGGKFNPEVLEALRVHLVKGSKETVRLGDVAQVVPKGRTLQVVVGEVDHVKPVTSAIQSSNLSLTPQPDASHRATLNINIPPPTGESRQAVIDTAKKAGEGASTAVRNARQAHQKKIRAAEGGRQFRPDDLKKAGKEMEKVVEKGGQEVKKILEDKVKVLSNA